MASPSTAASAGRAPLTQEERDNIRTRLWRGARHARGAEPRAGTLDSEAAMAEVFARADSDSDPSESEEEGHRKTRFLVECGNHGVQFANDQIRQLQDSVDKLQSSVDDLKTGLRVTLKEVRAARREARRAVHVALQVDVDVNTRNRTD